MDSFEILLVGLILIFMAATLLFVFMYAVTREKRYQIMAVFIAILSLLFLLLFGITYFK